LLAVWEEIGGETSLARCAWVLVHLNDATPQQLERIRRLGVMATTKPDFVSLRARALRRRLIAARPPPSGCCRHRSLARLAHSVSGSPRTTIRPTCGARSARPWTAVTMASGGCSVPAAG